YGGSCFPKDVKALIKTGNDYKYKLRILQSVEDVNDDQKLVVYNKLSGHFKDLKGLTIGIWGLSFKPNTDDMREAPALVLIEQLLEQGAKVKAYDPVAVHECKRKIGDVIEYVEDAYEAVIDVDALVLMTEWSEFRVPNFKVLNKLMKQKIVFDGRNIYDPVEMIDNGFTYFGIGRNIN
ncbi:MAG: UDP-glucose 6-dehydrogenase, partial [Bacteroidales bacterium]|nr:UDP-glucose 6-dehydrogenase [Bacteroidales bacterium]